jgi:GTP cyclohydrolase II
MIVRLGEGRLKTKFGDFLEVLYYDGKKESLAIVMGEVSDGEEILCRVHSSCISGHIFNSVECDCREQLAMSQFWIEQAGKGVVIWLDQEGKGNGHLAILASRPLKAQGLGQADAYEKLGYKRDARDFRQAAEILQDLGVKSVILLTDNPQKADDLTNLGIRVSGTRRVDIRVEGDEKVWKTFQDKLTG